VYWCLLKLVLVLSDKFHGNLLIGSRITLAGKNKSLTFKIWADSYSFDFAESEYDNEIALSPTSV
jgi:hypothetical protein